MLLLVHAEHSAPTVLLLLPVLQLLLLQLHVLLLQLHALPLQPQLSSSGIAAACNKGDAMSC